MKKILKKILEILFPSPEITLTQTIVLKKREIVEGEDFDEHACYDIQNKPGIIRASRHAKSKSADDAWRDKEKREEKERIRKLRTF